MFERGNRADYRANQPVSCEIVLDDGRKLAGNIVQSSVKGLGETLNAAGDFVEFESFERERLFLSKRMIRSIKPTVIPKQKNFTSELRNSDQFDPYAVLGLEPSASRDQVREAYHALAKAYHPDRLQGMGLPLEVIEYATAMAKRINAAYSALSAAA
jgi:hypothetical protein